MLEKKLGGGASAAKGGNKQPQADPNVGKMREIGKASKAEAQRVVMDGIKKPGQQSAAQENTPKSILKKPGVSKMTPQRAT